MQSVMTVHLLRQSAWRLLIRVLLFDSVVLVLTPADPQRDLRRML